MSPLVADDFNRGDSSTLGGSWTEVSGDWGISSNQLAVSATAGFLIWDADLGTPNYRVTLELTAISGYGGIGVVARYVDASNLYLLQYFNGDIQLWRCVADTWTQLDHSNLGAELCTLALEVQGTALRGYRNGTLCASAVDSSFSAAGRAGCRAGSSYSGQLADNFLVEALAGTYTALGAAPLGGLAALGAGTQPPARTASGQAPGAALQAAGTGLRDARLGVGAAGLRALAGAGAGTAAAPAGRAGALLLVGVGR